MYRLSLDWSLARPCHHHHHQNINRPLLVHRTHRYRKLIDSPGNTVATETAAAATILHMKLTLTVATATSAAVGVDYNYWKFQIKQYDNTNNIIIIIKYCYTPLFAVCSKCFSLHQFYGGVVPDLCVGTTAYLFVFIRGC